MRNLLLEAIKQIAEYEVESPVDRWTEAEAFRACQRLAREALKAAGMPHE